MKSKTQEVKWSDCSALDAENELSQEYVCDQENHDGIIKTQ